MTLINKTRARATYGRGCGVINKNAHFSSHGPFILIQFADFPAKDLLQKNT